VPVGCKANTHRRLSTKMIDGKELIHWECKMEEHAVKRSEAIPALLASAGDKRTLSPCDAQCNTDCFGSGFVHFSTQCMQRS
jgi:hypothetical protein